MTDWRDDPAWQLAAYDPAVLKDKPGDRPADGAELAQPDAWASLYAGSQQVAVWSRVPSAPGATIATDERRA